MTALPISPSVLVNRIVLEEGDTTTPHLAKVAKLRADLLEAAKDKQAEAAALAPDEPPPPLDLDTGAIVDLLA